MPPPKKVDRLPGEIRDWLRQTLKDAGFSGYEQIAEELNARLEAEGHELRLARASVQRFGQEYREFVRYQEEAGAWAAEWITDAGLADEADRHGVLFQMLTTLAFKYMKGQMDEGHEIDPKDLHFIGRMMKDIMASSGIREQLAEKERARIQAAERARAAEAVVSVAASQGMSGATVEAIKAEILGVKGDG